MRSTVYVESLVSRRNAKGVKIAFEGYSDRSDRRNGSSGSYTQSQTAIRARRYRVIDERFCVGAHLIMKLHEAFRASSCCWMDGAELRRARVLLLRVEGSVLRPIHAAFEYGFKERFNGLELNPKVPTIKSIRLCTATISFAQIFPQSDSCHFHGLPHSFRTISAPFAIGAPTSPPPSF
jgi:hypothetical protein